MLEYRDLQSVHRHEVATVTAPSFVQPVPRVQNLHLVPKPVLEAMRAGWLTGTHPERSVTLTKLFDVYVTEEGLVFTHDRKLITQTITQHSPDECERAFERVRCAQDVPEVTASSLLLRKRGDHNYGHWLVELLPRLWLAEQFMTPELLIVPHADHAMTHVIRDSIVLSSARPHQFLALDNQAVCFFKELSIVDGLTDHGVYMSPLAFAKTDIMRGAVPQIAPQRLYVARPGSPRCVVQEENLLALLHRHGFRVVDPAGLTFLEQIQLFKNAECVVGVMGAGMTNILFCPPGAKVITLAPATMPDTFFAFIAGLRGLEYHELRGQMMDTETTRWDAPFSIMAAQLAALLEG
ncbi:hypothetical protein HK16_16025 [Acetobacter senegalensis]|uniref:Glycosyltransferase 61 catalytic domain-containing protein n=2 Tax=Acetobacter TaxID=434 RepID=A0A252EGA1_9PROT|nr:MULTISPECIES: glycosyltransferase family 61 protein [Acetobacter]ATJ92227.1 DUF563 domain-containing protein [Acetobacter tropicalis]OUL65498.1 hypothetical protein HK16_16025 [Acetobacter senegalensis]